MIPDHAIWVRFPRMVGDAAMQLPVLRLLRQMEVGPIVVWGPPAATSLLAETRVIAADQIAARKPSLLSPMPEGLLNRLSIQDVRDLVKYLSSPDRKVILLATRKQTTIMIQKMNQVLMNPQQSDK